MNLWTIVFFIAASAILALTVVLASRQRARAKVVGEYKNKVRQWEAEGYDVEKLKQKWFGWKTKGIGHLVTALGLTVTVALIVGAVFFVRPSSTSYIPPTPAPSPTPIPPTSSPTSHVQTHVPAPASPQPTPTRTYTPVPTPTSTPRVTPTPTPVPKPRKVYKLNYANLFPPTHGHSILAERWCKEIEKRTNGQVKFSYYPGGTLVPANEMYDAVVHGTAHIGMSCLAYTPGRFPAAEAIDLPIGYPNGWVATNCLLYTSPSPRD